MRRRVHVLSATWRSEAGWTNVEIALLSVLLFAFVIAFGLGLRFFAHVLVEQIQDFSSSIVDPTGTDPSTPPPPPSPSP